MPQAIDASQPLRHSARRARQWAPAGRAERRARKNRLHCAEPLPLGVLVRIRYAVARRDDAAELSAAISGGASITAT